MMMVDAGVLTGGQYNGRADFPTVEQIEKELQRVGHWDRFIQALGSTIGIFLMVIAIAVIGANYAVSLLKVEGNSMSPTLEEGELHVVLRGSTLEKGEIVTFYYNNKLLVKRVIAGPGDWIDIDPEGSVWVNDELLPEPYVVEKAYGDGDVTFPYQVPADRWFVMGDHRLTSVDSRYEMIGDVAGEQVYGRLLFRLWPPRFGR